MLARYTTEALEDARSIAKYLDSQSKGLGDGFRLELVQSVQAIVEQP